MGTFSINKRLYQEALQRHVDELPPHKLIAWKGFPRLCEMAGLDPKEVAYYLMVSRPWLMEHRNDRT